MKNIRIITEMKNILASILTIALSTSSVIGGGLYFLSGGDFRECHIKYTIETTQTNQIVNITPSRVRLLSQWIGPNNFKHTGPWSLKTEGVEYSYGKYDNIDYNNITENDTTSKGNPTFHTFKNPGNHLVKCYDVMDNIYLCYFRRNDQLTSLYLNFNNIKSLPYFYSSMDLNVSECPKLRSLYYSNLSDTIGSTSFQGMSNLVNCVILNPEKIKTIRYAWNPGPCPMTNDCIFVNATNVTGSFFCSLGVKYASFPKAEKLGGFNLSAAHQINTYSGKTWFNTYPNWGLTKLRIGDKLKQIETNSFWLQSKLKEIEFVTDKENWIDEWNNNPYLLDCFGRATIQDNQSSVSETSLSPILESELSTGVWSSGAFSQGPKPTKLTLIRP